MSEPREPGPQPPWPIGAGNNAKREGWRRFFLGLPRKSPFPADRPDLDADHATGWDEAAIHQMAFTRSASVSGRIVVEPKATPAADTQAASEMVERVARALCKENLALSFRDERLSAQVETYWSEYARLARAAILAMREPTAAMVEEGDEWSSVPESWRAMVCVALGEGSDD